MPSIIESVVYQHAENACSLWWQWHNARHEPHYDFSELQALESRIDANLDGLLIAGDAALPFLQELIDADDEGALFTSAIQALRKGDRARFMNLLDAFRDQSHALKELDSALAWIHDRHLQGVAAPLLDSSEAHHRLLGLSACLAHHRDPCQHLRNSLSHEDHRIRAQALRVAANLGDTDILQYLTTQSAETDQERFELARALLFLGKRSDAHDRLEKLALNEGPLASRATRLFLLSVNKSRPRELLRQLDADPARQRDVVRGFGLLGDPRAMEWLIEKCRDDAVARLAGESIALITGVALADNDLDREDAPEEADTAPNDDPADDNVQLDEDENLDWPHADRIAAWWHSSRNQLTSGGAYLCGNQRSPEGLRQVLHHGRQPQRAVAADLIMLQHSGSRYCDTTLPTHRQLDFMSKFVAKFVARVGS